MLPQICTSYAADRITMRMNARRRRQVNVQFIHMPSSPASIVNNIYTLVTCISCMHKINARAIGTYILHY